MLFAKKKADYGAKTVILEMLKTTLKIFDNT